MFHFPAAVITASTTLLVLAPSSIYRLLWRSSRWVYLLSKIRREKINSGKSAIDITANPQITLTKNITDSSRRKCHTLPKSLDASKLEDLTMKNELPNSIKLDNRTKKREKISNMLNSIAGEKKEIMRYDFPNKCGSVHGLTVIKIITKYPYFDC